MLKNKVIVITGGLGLLGQEFVKTVLENNGIAIIADIRENCNIEDLNTYFSGYDQGSIDYFCTDITSEKSLLDLIDFTKNKYSKIDALVNNAYPRNKNYGRSFFNVKYDDFCENISMHIGGYVLASQQFAKYFKSYGIGNILNISSIYGVIPPKFEVYDNTNMTMPVEYAVIKSGLIHFTKYLAKYLKGENIRVNSISLGGIFDYQPEAFLEAYRFYCLNKGMLDKTDIKGTLTYLLSDMSKYVNGQNIIVDDGFTL